MVVTLNGASQCTNLPQPTDYLLMREELGIVRHDPVFERTLASAAALAYPTEQMSVQRFTAPDAAGGCPKLARITFSACWRQRCPARNRATLAVSGRNHSQAAVPEDGDDAVPVGPRAPVLRGRALRAAHRRRQQLQAGERLSDPAGAHSARARCIASPGELAPKAAAARYAAEIREFFGLEEGEMPRFRHRASRHGSGRAHRQPVSRRSADRRPRRNRGGDALPRKFNQWRVTLLPGVLQAARHTVFLVAGEDKAEAVRAVFHESTIRKSTRRRSFEYTARGGLVPAGLPAATTNRYA